MCPYEAHVDDAIRVVDPNDDSILVTGYVEDDSAVFENGRIADLSLCRVVVMGGVPECDKSAGLRRLT